MGSHDGTAGVRPTHVVQQDQWDSLPLGVHQLRWPFLVKGESAHSAPALGVSHRLPTTGDRPLGEMELGSQPGQKL